MKTQNKLLLVMAISWACVSPTWAIVSFDTDPLWTGLNNAVLGNSFGYSPGTAEAGGTTGEAGGTFAKASTNAFYADTGLSQTYTLNNVITATGKVDFLDITTGAGGWADNDGGARGAVFLGHFSESTAANANEIMGFEFRGNDQTTSVEVRGIYHLLTTGDNDVSFGNLSINGNHTWSYSYDPNFESDGGHAGPEGRVTFKFDATTLSVNLTDGQRDGGASLDAFGIGYVPDQNTPTDAADTAKFFIDDLSYSGLVVVPEPSSIVLLVTGGFLAWRQRRKVPHAEAPCEG